MADLSASGPTPLPIPGASFGVWADLYNAALTAVNKDVEASKAALTETVASAGFERMEPISRAEWNALTVRPVTTLYVFTDPA